MADPLEYERTHPWIAFRHRLDRAGPLHWRLLGEAVARCDRIGRAILPPPDADEMRRAYLAKGVQATTAIEGNTLTEAQVRARMEGRLELPLSRQHQGREVDNALEAVGGVFAAVLEGSPPQLSPEWMADANRRLLAGLEAHLEDGVVPGEVPTHSVGVGRYRAPPRGECAFLLGRLCRWIEDEDRWPTFPEQSAGRTGSAILRAVYAHLYIAWIHPYGDGNGRTARLAEVMILAREGAPSPCVHLLANHYNRTRPEYYRQLDRSSRANAGRGDPLGFLLYALQGLVDGLREQSRFVERTQLILAWERFVYNLFRARPMTKASRRRREVALALGRHGAPARKRAIPVLNPALAAFYADKTRKTLTRDVNWLEREGLVEREGEGYRASLERMRAFLPAQGLRVD